MNKEKCKKCYHCDLSKNICILDGEPIEQRQGIACCVFLDKEDNYESFLQEKSMVEK